VALSKLDHGSELASERNRIAFLYAWLDGRRTRAAGELDRALKDTSDTDPEARWYRQVNVDMLSERVNRSRVAASGLCFGRLDGTDDERTYIGRIGLFDEDDDYEPLLIDWRAPASRPFYCATGANPEGVRVRRHFHTRGRAVLDFQDDVFDGGTSADDNSAGDNSAASDTALMAAVDAPRSESMRDIVATIQAEQDDIIRLDHDGVLVVEGGPGTGKTAVALHRIAYLLYTRRERLARSGVLVVGPNPGFLRYVDQVLPSLGETAVVFATTGGLLPGLRTTRQDTPRAARVKGDDAMLGVLRAAIADRQEVPEEPIAIGLTDVTVALDGQVVAAARARARATGLPHNEARAVFRSAVLVALAERAVDAIGDGWLEPGESPDVRADLLTDVKAELRVHPELRSALAVLWPTLTPQRLLRDLYGSPERLAVAAAALSEQDRDDLYRPAPTKAGPTEPDDTATNDTEADDTAWTVSDVPLLDEAIDLLGRDDRAAERAARARRAAELDYAEGVLSILDTDEDPDGEVLRAVDLVDTDRMTERQVVRDHRPLAQRAVEDRDWTYGHVVVDEAQELSDMDWRMITRHCPSRSMTVVGDLAQRRSPAGARTWADALDEYVPGRWAYRELTVNYRNPAELMAVAAWVLAEVDPAPRPPTSVRHNGTQPWARVVTEATLNAELAEAVTTEQAKVGDGSVAVIVPEGLSVEVPGATVLTPTGAKGLEFDSVIVVAPEEIRTAHDEGAADLYVALSRATQRLGVLHSEPLPRCLEGAFVAR
jgi:DNA helicase IV